MEFSFGALRAGSRTAPRPTLRVLRWCGPLAYGIALSVQTLQGGLPVSRDRLLIWIVLGLLAFSLTDLRRWIRSVLLEWLPMAAILYVYDLLRGYADGLWLPAHIEPHLWAEEVLFFGPPVPTVWLQQHLWDGIDHLHWYDYALWGVYVSHFFGTLVVAAALWLFAPRRFRRWVTMVCLLAFMAFAVYVLYPAIPPWMASEHADIPRTTRIVGHIWREIPVAAFQPLFDGGQRFANNVAAMPSLHAAYALLITLFLWPGARLHWRLLLAAYPPAMGLALVYSAEHFVVDVLAGWVAAYGAFWAVNALARRPRWASLFEGARAGAR